MSYLLHLIIYFSIYGVLAISLNVVVGYCGLLTLAHAAFFALGGYSYALARIAFGWGFLPALALVAVITGSLSLAVSLPTWRLGGDFFVLASLAAQTVIMGALQNWYSPEAPLGSFRTSPMARSE